MSDLHKDQLSTQRKKSGWSDVHINVNVIYSTLSQELSEKEDLRMADLDLDSYLQYLQNEMGVQFKSISGNGSNPAFMLQ